MEDGSPRVAGQRTRPAIRGRPARGAALRVARRHSHRTFGASPGAPAFASKRSREGSVALGRARKQPMSTSSSPLTHAIGAAQAASLYPVGGLAAELVPQLLLRALVLLDHAPHVGEDRCAQPEEEDRVERDVRDEPARAESGRPAQPVGQPRERGAPGERDGALLPDLAPRSPRPRGRAEPQCPVPRAGREREEAGEPPPELGAMRVCLTRGGWRA